MWHRGWRGMLSSLLALEDAMAQVLVRDLPEEVVERLKAKAAAEGRSLEAHLRAILEDASSLNREQFLALADASAATTRDREQSDSTEVIRAARDRGWR
jgi:plasmid stability protein